jgi:heme oxygenase
VLSDLGPLHAATRDLHHAVEQTALGRSMADGTVSAQAWADWLDVLLRLHEEVDEWMPPVLRRAEAVLEDLMELPAARRVDSADLFIAKTWCERTAIGAGYVVVGAHLMGGAIIAKKIGGRLPTRHLQWGDRKAALLAFKPLRHRADCTDGAVGCFEALLDVCRAIEARDAKIMER